MTATDARETRPVMPEECTLADGEWETWRAITLLVTTLPAVFDTQLQRDSDVSFLEYTVMAHLSSRPDRSTRLSDLAAHANCERSRLSHLLTRLETRGFVTRAPDPDDGRHMTATLTRAGHAHLAAAAPGHISLVRSLIFNRLDPTQQQLLREIA
ncbi:MarR family winged helix-turn-helix transcriptional regulator, partial [Microbacterium sp. AGC85]